MVKKLRKVHFLLKILLTFLGARQNKSGLSNLDFFVYLDYFELKLITWIKIQIRVSFLIQRVQCEIPLRH